MSLKGLRFTLEVDGQEPDTFAVVSFRLIQNQSYPFVLNVDVASDSFMQTAEMLLEKNATLTIWQGVIPLRYVTGVVAGFGMQENNGWQMRYHLRIQPPLWRCGLRQNFRIFQQQDIRTISATLLNENGVTEWTPLFYEDHPAREFCVQYGESDLAFLARLWAEEGIFFFERFAADSPEQKLTLCDDVAGLSQAGEFPFNPDTSAGAETECVSMFRYEAHVRPSSVQSQDYTFKVPDWPGMYEQQGENHISLVEGKHSLEVKGDLAEKVSGALGIKVDGEIVLESSSQISLKVGGSFIVIQPGGVDILGRKINLNGGGSPGTPVPTLQPTVLKTPGGEKSGDGSDSGEENEDPGGSGLAGSGGGDRGDDEDEPEKYTLQFHFTDDDGIPYSEIRYIAFFEDGAQIRGETDKDGYTEVFSRTNDANVEIKLLTNDYYIFEVNCNEHQ